ncbi:MAG: hypothetical protein ACKOC8_05255 [Pirellulales bacterium]
MNLRHIGKHLEKAWLRPLSQRLRRRLGMPRLSWSGSRVAVLEQRVDELESLVRELTGLAYLRLDREADPDAAVEADRAVA